MSKHSRQYIKPKERNYRIAVKGKQRDDIDTNLLAQAIVMLGHQLDSERKFLQWLFEQDRRTVERSIDRHPVVFLDERPFMLIDGGRLVCRLPEPTRTEILQRLGNTIDGARRYRHGEHAIWSDRIEMPEETDRGSWERYALEALHYVDDK